MLKTSRSYQAKIISSSIRKRIDTEKVEEVLRKKKDESFYSVKSEGRLPASKLCKLPLPKNLGMASTAKLPSQRFASEVKIKKQILNKYVSDKLHLSKNSEVKWFSAFKNRKPAENPFEGRSIHATKRQDSARDQVKVLNIDRLFKGNHKVGMSNVLHPKELTPSKKPIPPKSLHV